MSGTPSKRSMSRARSPGGSSCGDTQAISASCGATVDDSQSIVYSKSAQIAMAGGHFDARLWLRMSDVKSDDVDDGESS